MARQLVPHHPALQLAEHAHIAERLCAGALIYRASPSREAAGAVDAQAQHVRAPPDVAPAAVEDAESTGGCASCSMRPDGRPIASKETSVS